jgi:site-specific recombinase XerD
VDELVLARWLARRRQAVAVNTVNLDLKALRSFYRLQEASGAASKGCLLAIPKGKRPPRRVVRYLTDEQIGEVLGSLPLTTFTGLRDYTMIRTLFETGLRASELVQLELGCILVDNTLFVRGKGGKDRYVPITAQLAGVLAGYRNAHGGTRPGKRSALWVTARGKPLRNGRSIWEIVSRRLWAALGVRSGLHRLQRGRVPWQGHYPHALRASFATALLRNGCPITAIAQMMGHADVATTALYLGVDLTQLRAAAAHHPRALRVVDNSPLETHFGESGSVDRFNNS